MTPRDELQLTPEGMAAILADSLVADLKLLCDRLVRTFDVFLKTQETLDALLTQEQKERALSCLDRYVQKTQHILDKENKS